MYLAGTISDFGFLLHLNLILNFFLLVTNFRIDSFFVCAGERKFRNGVEKI